MTNRSSCSYNSKSRYESGVWIDAQNGVIGTSAELRSLSTMSRRSRPTASISDGSSQAAPESSENEAGFYPPILRCQHWTDLSLEFDPLQSSRRASGAIRLPRHLPDRFRAWRPAAGQSGGDWVAVLNSIFRFVRSKHGTNGPGEGFSSHYRGMSGKRPN